MEEKDLNYTGMSKVSMVVIKK